MSADTDTNPQPTPNSPEDWGAPEPDEVRLPPPAPDPADQPDPDNAAVEGDDEPDTPAKAKADDDDPIGDDPEDGGEDDGPEFWSKEDKAFWKQVPAELKPLLQKYERQRIEFANKKAEEAALERKNAMEAATKANQTGEQFLAWWQANAENFTKTFVDRWQGVDWDKLVEENPAEWARLSQQRANEHAMLTQTHEQAQKVNAERIERVKAAQMEARQNEHAKLAKEFPKEFGSPEAAKRTYEVLGAYLQKQGFAPERINNVFEANLVKMVRKAYKYDQIQAKAKGITNPKPPGQSASTTPTRVVPGARTERANQVNEAVRQAEERLRSGERSGPDLALAFR